MQITYEDFRVRAKDKNLTRYEKIGFDNVYRDSHEKDIYIDISYYTGLNLRRCAQVMDIGCGCTDLPLMIIHTCNVQDHALHVVDSPEMLAVLKYDREVNNHVLEIAGEFPHTHDNTENKYDIIIAYSVLQHVEDASYFIRSAVNMLNPEGILFIGDIPNEDKGPKRSTSGVRFSNEFLMRMFSMYRGEGYEAYLVPHRIPLPLGMYRDNLLIKRVEFY